jgi:hypothetical protein
MILPLASALHSHATGQILRRFAMKGEFHVASFAKKAAAFFRLSCALLKCLKILADAEQSMGEINSES